MLNEKVNNVTTVSYTYDNQGNTLSKTENGVTTEYSWDFENRLIAAKVKDAGGVIQQQMQYRYNDNGIRVASIVNGVETRFLVDDVQNFAQVKEEYSTAGAVQVEYVYGNDLVSQSQGNQTSYYLVDGLGSTRVLTDGQGQVLNSYNYEAFGETIGSTGGAQNKYLFAGEQFDSNLGDYYNRARFYDADSGRFLRKDDYEGRIGEPVTLHDYLYGNGNPVSFTDPSGLFTMAELSAADSIRNILASIQIDTGNHLVAATLNGGNYGLNDILSAAATTAGLTAAVPLLASLLPKLRTTNIVGAAQARSGLRIPKELRVNPGYPGPPKFIGFQPKNMNCVNCVVTVDNILSGRGLQMAVPNKAGASIFELEDLYGNNFVDAFSQEHIEILMKEAGSGARAIVYGERAKDHGHVFNVANLGGEIVFIDGQSGRYANVKDFTNLGILRTN